MLGYLYRRLLTDSQKVGARRRLNRLRGTIASGLFRYDEEDLRAALRRLGVREGDTLLAHSSLKPFSGFGGTPQSLVRCLMDAVGEKGNLLMVSLPYTGSTAEYLDGAPVFDVRRTPSRMGVLTEIFRRKEGVLRSLHPTHPVLAWGAQARWLVAGHERCAYPCGSGSPFEKLRGMSGQVLFLDVPFNTFTFIHHLEDMVSESLPFALYEPESRACEVLDDQGRRSTVRTRAFSREAVTRRNPHRLRRALEEQGLIRGARVGSTRLMLVSVEDAVRTTREMVRRDPSFVFD